MRSRVLKNTLFPISSWQSKLFKTVTLLFTAAFVFFILTLILANIFFIDYKTMLYALNASFIRRSLWISIWTSSAAAAISLLFAIPIGYALSRSRSFARHFVDTIIDLPIVFPPFIAGLTLLIFFRNTALGRFIQQDLGLEFIFQTKGIILCQFLIAAGFAVRLTKIAFDSVSVKDEQVALTLGCNRFNAFRYVALPQAANGIIAGGILTWARSFGMFGPLLVFVGFKPGKTETVSSAMYLEYTAGRLETAIAAALLAVFIAFIAILTTRLVTRKVVPGL